MTCMERHLAQLAIKIDFIQKIVHRSTMVTCNYMQKGTMIALLKSFWSKSNLAWQDIYIQKNDYPFDCVTISINENVFSMNIFFFQNHD